MAVVMFSFGGVEMISLSAAEAKDPARSVATSVKAMIWRLSTFYVVSMAIILCLVPWQTAAQNSELTESPFVLVFSELGIPFAADIMNFVVLVAALSGANASCTRQPACCTPWALTAWLPRWLPAPLRVACRSWLCSSPSPALSWQP